MYKLFSLAFLAGLLMAGLVAAAPANELKPRWAMPGKQLSKRSYRIDRVAVSTGGQRSAVKAAVKAYNKYNIPVPAALKDAHAALRQAEALILKDGHKKKKGGKAAKGSKGSKGSKGGAGSASGNGTAAAGSASPTTGAGSLSGNGTAGVGAAASTGAAGAQAGTVAATPEANDVEFLAPITVGGQTMNMDFDTGSSDLWVFSTSLAAANQQGHQVFDPAKSSTFKPINGASFAISFGDGSAAQGNVVGTDTVNIGGATATNQAVELASAVSNSFVQDTNSNGLVGLAFSKLNTVTPAKQTTFLDTIKDDLAQPILAANLKKGTPGSYEFGQVDNTAFQGNLTSVPVDNSQGFWQVTSNKFQIGNGQVQQNTAGNPAIADTGTTLLLVDDNVAKAYYSQIQGAQLDQTQGLFTFPCNSQLQDFKVALGDTYMATIDKSLLNFQAINGTGAQANTCIGSMQSNQGSNLQIYGDILFKSQFTVFNIKDNTVSFAPHA